MNDRQRSQLDSSLAVRTVFSKEAYRGLWNGIPAVVLLHDRLLAKIALCNAAILIQGSDRTGVTEAKNDARAKLEAVTLEIAGLLSGYAYLTGNHDLESQTDIDPTTLRRLPDAEIDDKAQAIHDLGAALLAAPVPPAGTPAPGDAGLNAGKLDLLETRIETYNLLLGSPRAARGEKAVATQNLDTALKDIKDICERGLDKLMLTFRGTDFYGEYESARNPIAPRTPAKDTPETPATPTPSAVNPQS